MHVSRTSRTSLGFVSRQNGVDDVLGQSHREDHWHTRLLSFPHNALKVKETFSAGCSGSCVYHVSTIPPNHSVHVQL